MICLWCPLCTSPTR